ncbi:sigma factor-like helix-turn-helix DNA-binding protein [Patescibacteria group bacterium]
MTAKLKTISYADLVNTLLENLSNREREVLQKRNSIGDLPKHTLEQIGKDFNITRERVRQIEKEGLRKIAGFDYAKANLPVSDLEKMILDYLNSHGGIMAEDHLKEKLLNDQIEAEEKALDFVLNYILAERLSRVNDVQDHYIIWKIKDADLDTALAITEVLKDLISKHGKPLHINDLIEQFKSHDHWSHVDDHQSANELILEALLRLRKDVNSNILNQWGLHNWNTIRPKRMTDKAYLIMLRENRPLHFAEVADLINQADFDRKKACAATVHNELILDKKYVLVGRGIYALKEWGYEQGTVADIISKILQANGAMTKKDLTEEVLKQRLVQKTTITLALMNKDSPTTKIPSKKPNMPPISLSIVLRKGITCTILKILSST